MPWMMPLLAWMSGLTTVLQMMPLLGEQSQCLQVRWQKPPCHWAAREDCAQAGAGAAQEGGEKAGRCQALLPRAYYV
jgi:hypothetical protein